MTQGWNWKSKLNSLQKEHTWNWASALVALPAMESFSSTWPGALAALLCSLSGLWSCTVWAWPQLPRPPKHLLLACKFSNLRDKVASQAVVLLWVRHQTHRGWEIVTLCNHPAAAVLEHPHSLSAPSSAARGTEHWLQGYLCGQILNEMQDTQEMFAPASSWQLQCICNMG